MSRYAWIIFLFIGLEGYGQKPTACASLNQRANSNGNASSCPNVSGTLYAANFIGTSYATVPTSAKTGTLQLTYSGANVGLLPYAITQVWLTNGGSTIQNVQFGPAGVPVISGSTTQVNYCFYGNNLPTAGTLSFQFTDPQTNVVWGICSYDASCNSNCVVVANPTTLPVKLEYFTAAASSSSSSGSASGSSSGSFSDAAVILKWATAQEQNDKGFTIERSSGDSGFTAIGFVATKNPGGNSSIETDYSFTDQAPAAGRMAYRLRQEDLDGNMTYSEVAVVNISGGAASIAIYGAGDQVKIDLSGGTAAFSALVYDTQGRTLKRMVIQSAGITTISDLPRHSVYYVAVNSMNGRVRVMKAVYVN